MDLLPQNIEMRADVMMGKPCLKGARIPVYLAYPQGTKEHLAAALPYAAGILFKISRRKTEVAP